MPLTQADRRFMWIVDRIRMCLLAVAAAALLFLLFTPPNQIQIATIILGICLCWLIWLTQRLLSLITQLDVELKKAIDTLKRAIPAKVLQEFKRPG